MMQVGVLSKCWVQLGESPPGGRPCAVQGKLIDKCFPKKRLYTYATWQKHRDVTAATGNGIQVR
jgi:hypothetical protein